jgi:aspartyl-tRNA(Asn)/glutamyl-tRNA(Gln) amidotransferase subunit A
MKVDTNVIDNCLKAINKAKKLKHLNMFITDTHDLALKQAEKSHERIVKQSNLFIKFNIFYKLLLNMIHFKDKPQSKVDGKIVSIKDNFSTESILTTCGSKMLENYIPPYNATVVEKILNAGSVLIGKTNLDEFGMGSVSSSYFGTVKNPFNIIKNKNIDQNTNDFYVSGGSSGGSAASVTSGVADLYDIILFPNKLIINEKGNAFFNNIQSF